MSAATQSRAAGARRRWLVVLVVVALLVASGLVAGYRYATSAAWVRGRGCAMMPPEGQAAYGLGVFGRCQELKNAGHVVGSVYASDYVMIFPGGSIMVLRIDFHRGDVAHARAVEVSAADAPGLDDYYRDEVREAVKERGALTEPFDVELRS